MHAAPQRSGQLPEAFAAGARQQGGEVGLDQFEQALDAQVGAGAWLHVDRQVVLEQHAESVGMILCKADVGQRKCLQALLRSTRSVDCVAQLAVNRISRALVDDRQQIVLVLENQIELADGVADRVGHLAHRQTGKAFAHEDQLRCSDCHVPLLFARMQITAAHRSSLKNDSNILARE